MKKYTETHEWIRLDNDIGTVGICENAQSELGSTVYVELPEVGRHVTAGQEAAVLESTKAAVDVYAPVSGTILNVNTSLQHDPELVNRSPENEGWIFQIKLSNPDEFNGLRD